MNGTCGSMWNKIGIKLLSIILRHEIKIISPIFNYIRIGTLIIIMDMTYYLKNGNWYNK